MRTDEVIFYNRPGIYKLSLKYMDVWDAITKIDGQEPQALSTWYENGHDEFIYNGIQFRTSQEYKEKKNA